MTEERRLHLVSPRLVVVHDREREEGGYAVYDAESGAERGALGARFHELMLCGDAGRLAGNGPYRRSHMSLPTWLDARAKAVDRFEKSGADEYNYETAFEDRGQVENAHGPAWCRVTFTTRWKYDPTGAHTSSHNTVSRQEKVDGVTRVGLELFS